MKKHILQLALGISAMCLLMTSFVSAQELKGLKSSLGPLQQVAGDAGVADKANLADVVGTIINVALSLVGIIFLLLMVYGGYLWLASRGEESEIEKSKEIIKSSIIGLVIVMSAYAITFLVTSRFQ